MEKKKILFLNFSLHSGGIEKSLVTLLSLFDYDRYEVDLQLFADEGLFLDRVPEQVHHLPSLFPGEYRKNIREALPILLRQGHPLIALCRLLVTFAGKTRGEMGDRLYRMWRIEKHFVRAPKKEYDAVVAFMEGQPIYYAVSKVRAKRKIGFIHGDYGAMGLNADLDRRYVARLDALCTVSESCRAALCKAFPGGDAKFHVIYNIISARFMRQMAEASADFGDSFTGPRILTIARLSHQKGLDLALLAAMLMKKRGYAFRWYIIGVGPEEADLKLQAKELGLSETVVFLGERGNPYPFLRACDIYAQTSRFEGKSIAVDEAMVMARPILLTDFSTAADQIDSEKNGLIVPMTPEGIAEGLQRLLSDGALRERFTAALFACDYTNEGEIEKLYALLEGKPFPAT